MTAFFWVLGFGCLGVVRWLSQDAGMSDSGVQRRQSVIHRRAFPASDDPRTHVSKVLEECLRTANMIVQHSERCDDPDAPVSIDGWFTQGWFADSEPGVVEFDIRVRLGVVLSTETFGPVALCSASVSEPIVPRLCRSRWLWSVFADAWAAES